MSKRGVSKISGNSSPKVGEATTYTITDWYPATPQTQRNASGVTWELFKKRTNGRFTTTNIKKTGSGTFTFGEVAQKNTYRLEAYLFEAEGGGPSSIEITPQPVAVPKIDKVELQYVDDSPGTVFSYTEKMRARAQCVNLNGKKLKFSLWEDDAAGDGHHAGNLLIETKEATVNSSGVAVAEFMLTRALMQKAMQGETDPKQLEFYVTVEYFADRKHATENRNVNNPLHNPAPTPQQRPQQPANHPAPSQPRQAPANNAPPRAANSPAATKPQSRKEETGIVETVKGYAKELWDWAESKGTITPSKTPTQQPAGGKTVSIVQDSGVENLLDAYFAKKEYTKLTGEANGNHVYTFGGRKANNKTTTPEEKAKVADTVLKKIAPALKKDKKYTTKETIIQALTANEYGTDTENNKSVTIPVFKLGAEFKKINSAPLDSKVYLVARTSGLNGKQATIIIKEKDGFLKGSAGAVLPVLEITEEQMEQASPTTGEIPGTEKTEFKATIENGMAKVPVHLRPKSNDDLKIWREKLAKGKEDGEYTYKFGGPNPIANEADKRRIADIILGIAKKGNANNVKIADDKTAFINDIESVLEIKAYKLNDTIKFKLYKKQSELLYLHAKAQGEKLHEKDFLKTDGAYFQLTKTKPVIFPLRVKPENDTGKTWGQNYYWAASQGSNMTTFNSNRSKGTRKHAGRDLYTLPETEIVAMADGTVLKTDPFYAGTDYIAVHHTTNDGREFIINYGEVAPGKKEVKAGDKVVQGQKLGVTGYLHGITVISGHTIYMIHFEHYTGSEGFDLDKNHILSGDNRYKRRSDLVDPLEILQEGYRNTFEEDTDDGELFTVEDGKAAIEELYSRYKDSKWNWKWEGSDEEVEVTGKDLVTIVEKMYRLETAHFGSKQYQHCGTGGMEAFGEPPYYGWDSTLFIEQPTGTWSAFEGKGLSGAGGNTQITDKQKEFVKLPSVLAGMEYKAKYIIKYQGNYARWFNAKDTTAQTAYRTSLQNIRARFTDAIQ
jgi:murein DD-endopeptidase MepM/ murein hydrolase activator NlpD